VAVTATGIALAVSGSPERDAYYAWCEANGGVAWNNGSFDICTVGDLPDDALVDALIENADRQD
jgi:hypothetical protein